MRKTDAVCTSPNLEGDCVIDPMAIEVNKKADIPPVLSVVNVLLGLQLQRQGSCTFTSMRVFTRFGS